MSKKSKKTGVPERHHDRPQETRESRAAAAALPDDRRSEPRAAATEAMARIAPVTGLRHAFQLQGDAVASRLEPARALVAEADFRRGRIWN
jgi:hypothetical protein